MKILLTGHKGFIGSNMLSYLTEKTDHEVTTFEWGEAKPAIEGLDWVFHIGAISSTTETDVDKVMRQNYEFTIDLYNECKEHSVNFQFSSSASVYGLKNEFKETSPVDPRTPYAWSKYLVERYIQQHLPTNSIAQCFRYFNVHGPGEEHKGTQASPYCQFSNQAKTNGNIRVFEDSDKYQRDFIHVDQIIENHMKFLDVKQHGIFNFGTGQTTSFLTIAESFMVPITQIPMPAQLHNSYQVYTCADTTLFNETITTK